MEVAVVEGNASIKVQLRSSDSYLLHLMSLTLNLYNVSAVWLYKNHETPLNFSPIFAG